MSHSKPQISVEEAIIKARTFCNYRERCHLELKQKLYDLGLWTKDVEHVIGQMIEEKLLNEERFARSYARGHFYQKKWGKYKIAVELKQRGLNQKLIHLALTEIADDDYDLCIEKLIEQKLKLIRGNQLTKRQKIIQFLNQKGYTFSEIKNILDRVFRA